MFEIKKNKNVKGYTRSKVTDSFYSHTVHLCFEIFWQVKMGGIFSQTHNQDLDQLLTLLDVPVKMILGVAVVMTRDR